MHYIQLLFFLLTLLINFGRDMAMRRFCRILCFLLLTVAILCRNAVAQARPHIILIVADDLVRAKIIISFCFRFSYMYSQSKCKIAN